MFHYCFMSLDEAMSWAYTAYVSLEQPQNYLWHVFMLKILTFFITILKTLGKWQAHIIKQPIKMTFAFVMLICSL